MMLSGIQVKAQRHGEKGRAAQWVDVDITQLTDEEFGKWWSSIESEQDRFLIALTLRRLCVTASDFGDSIAP